MNILISLIMILIFFIQGRIFEVLKKIVSLFIKIVFNILKLLGIRVNGVESKLRTSKQFKENFKEIKLVKESKENIKLKHSISIPNVIIFGISLIAIIINLKYGIITKWIYSLKWIQWILKSEQSVDTMITATAFSFISLSLSALLNQWKETSNYRQAKREIRNRNFILKSMKSKELLKLAKEKDQESLNSISKRDLDKEP